MEMAPLLPPHGPPNECFQVPQPPSRASPDPDRGSERRREDRRRARLNTELLTAVLPGGSEEQVQWSLDAGASPNATCRPTGTTALHLAAACRRSGVAGLLLAGGADARRRDLEGRQAVHIAAAMGDALTLRLLLDNCDTINSQVDDIAAGMEPRDNDSLDSWSHDHGSVAGKIPPVTQGASALHLAAQRAHLQCVNLLLERGAKVDLQDRRGLTALDVVGELAPQHTVLSGAMINRVNYPVIFPGNHDMSFLRVANEDSYDPVDSGAIVVSVDSDDPVDFGAMIGSGESDAPVISPRDFHAMAFDPDSRPAASTSGQPENRRQDLSKMSVAERIVNSLIDQGAKVPDTKVVVEQGTNQIQVMMQANCLHTAVEQEDIHLIEFLLDNGACQLTWNKEGLTPIHLAVTKRLLEPFRVLLERNKSSQVVDARDYHGRTPLHLAVALEWFPGVSLLLEAGADVKVTTNDSETVLHFAAVLEDCKLLEELLTIPESIEIMERGNSVHETPLSCAVSGGRLACVELLLARGADVTATLPGDVSLLHVAAERGDAAVLGRLLRDQRTAALRSLRTKEGKGGVTALHFAAFGGFVPCVEILISSGCNVYDVTSEYPFRGSTPLHLAAIEGHTKVVEVIVKHDKNTLGIKNDEGWYPLHIAARFSKKECVRFMLLNGANLGAIICDSAGNEKTAFDIIVYSILHPVTFLEKIFDRCIEVNEFPLNSPKCEVRVRYNILQPLGPNRKQLRVLDSLLNCEKDIVHEKLLLHPLIETFLYLKWKRLRVFFFLMLALYFVFTASLTTLAMSFYVLKMPSTFLNTCVYGCRVTLCISLGLLTLQEVLQAARMLRYYCWDVESWVKWTTLVLSAVVLGGPHPADWLVHVSAVAVLLSWLELLLLLSRWPSFLGFYVLMFSAVAKNVLRVMATFFFVILGFMFAFMIHFRATGQFSGWWQSFVKVMVMAMEFEYQSMFENAEGADAIVGRGIFLSFMVLVAIVLMNLLVGLAVSDIALLEKQGRAERLAKQIDFLSMLEMFVYNQSLFACCPNKVNEVIKRCRAVDGDLTIEPGRPLHKYKHPLTERLQKSVINSIIERKTKTEEDSEDDLGETNDEKSHEEGREGKDNSLKQLQGDKQVNNSLKKIMNKLNVIIQEIESMKVKGQYTTKP